jgi:hypothetical protein
MKPHSHFLTPILAIVLIGNLTANPVAQPQVSFTAGSNDTWIADWLGIYQRTYFSQCSVDLTSWEYVPVIEFGDGMKSLGVDTTAAPKFFFRLKYTDDPTTDPEIEDFDSDNIGSLAELLIGHDPLVAEPFVDTDGDGISDAIEMHWYQNLTTMNATSDSDGDGIPDMIEANAGADPTTNQSANPAERASYLYDVMGRLTEAEGVSYTFDIEGNLESSSN